jgi:hypothetical protein
VITSPFDPGEQKRRLLALVQDIAGWGVLIYISTPGDVDALVPIVPQLAGYEIVAASTDPDVYDIWVDDGVWAADWRRSDVAEWLARHTPPDSVLEAHAAEWASAVFERYGIARATP